MSNCKLDRVVIVTMIETHRSLNMREMPIIPIDHLTQEEQEIARGIIATQGKNKGRLRAAKPKIEYNIVIKDGRKLRHPTLETGRVAYLWRMVAFVVSPIGQHQCLPVCADFDLPGELSEMREKAKELDALADKITNAIPPQKWQGINRWARAFGMV